MNSRNERILFFFKKWYFDAQTDDGTFLFAYFAPMTLCGSRSAELVVSVYPAGGGEIRRSFHIGGSSLRIEPDYSGAEFGAGTLSVTAGGARFGFSIDGTTLALEYTGAAPAWIPALPMEEPGVLLSMKSRRLCWTVPIPHARVTGSVRSGGNSIAIRGVGYHDFVLTDIPPWSLPLRELLWGRALSDDAAVIWNRACFETGGKRTTAEFGWTKSADGTTETFSRVRAAFGAEREHAETTGRYPSEMELAMYRDGGRSVIAQVRDTQLLLGERVADVQKFRNGFERWLYRRFTNDPVEYKLLSSAYLPGVKDPLTAAHEWILWGKR